MFLFPPPSLHLPSEVELPVEASPGHVRGGDVLEALVGDDVDDGADDGPAVVGDLRQQRFQPALRALAVRVQERDHGAADVLGAKEPGRGKKERKGKKVRIQPKQ